MIPDSEGRMKINCLCLKLRIGDFAESSQESEGFSDRLLEVTFYWSRPRTIFENPAK